ncbi:unnamed protein product [Tuwongella immobilis]|uniref:Uncharacterized protein n=1 Tax=Tuwongella immobilis TaxID=692036 RepID=A0A6C2YIC5_9BACT|nr:unnamed protein product [Tuwongella immobilis]VTR98002.1 unnamed protein product [Tuwongella immobilis]
MNDTTWYCPLYAKQISEGLCLDINYERLGYFKGATIAEVTEETHRREPEISQTCESCPNQPLR